jgi:hypothetical protein
LTVPDKDNRRTQTDPGANVIEHPVDMDIEYAHEDADLFQKPFQWFMDSDRFDSQDPSAAIGLW